MNAEWLNIVCCHSAKLISRIAGSSDAGHKNVECSIPERGQAFRELAQLPKKSSSRGVKDSLSAVMQNFSDAFPELGNSLPPSNVFQKLQCNEPTTRVELAGFCDFLKESANNRAQQLVADWFLSEYLCGDHADSPATRAEDRIRQHFYERIQSQKIFFDWVRDGKWKTNPAPALPPGMAPVCVPVLIANTVTGTNSIPQRQGVVKWLTVELFRDGLTGLIPDLYTLGHTNINEPDSAGKSFLEYFDDVWTLSGLDRLGFSGRWRLLNRAPLHAEYVYPTLAEADQRLDSVSGNSAQAALLVALLAASGQVFAPVAELPADATVDRQYLNLDHAITAGVAGRPAVAGDPRNVVLVEVAEIGVKHAALETYARLHDKEDSPLRLNTILLSGADYKTRQQTAASSPSGIGRQPPKQAAEFGALHYQSATTIQDALDAMLECNQWSRAIRASTTGTWEAQWCYPRDKDQDILDRNGHKICDPQNVPIRDPNHPLVRERSLKSGSLEYMKLLADPQTPADVRQRLLGASEADESDAQATGDEQAAETDVV